VVLASGTFNLTGSLIIKTSGVVLRGAGSRAGGTLLKLGGAPRTLFTVGGSGKAEPIGQPANITDDYVAAGARTFHVDDASGFSVGATVLVQKPVTAAWVHFMGMDTLVRNGMPQTWIATGSLIHHDRVVTAVAGNQITIDAPLPDSLDAQYLRPPGATVVKYQFPGRISQVGIEGMHVVAPPMTSAINVPTFKLINLNATLDGWLKDIAGEGFINGAAVGGGSKQITIQEVSFTHTAAGDGSAGSPADFETTATQILFLRCSTVAGPAFSFPFATLSEADGPSVILQASCQGNGSIQPHERWGTGLLVDNADLPMGKIEYINRNTAGSGHGWAMGFGVVWNSNAQTLNMNNPPGAFNLAVGSKGSMQAGSTGLYDSNGTPVRPKSLYLQQLCERLGPQAVTNIGY
jgi:hypothetical protein